MSAATHSVILYCITAVLLVAGLVALFAKIDGSWLMFLAAVVFALIANAHHVAEFSLKITGISAKMKDVDARLADMRRLIALTSEIQLELIQSRGRPFYGGNEDRKQRFFDQTVKIMHDAQVPEETIERIAAETWHYWVEHDYAFYVLGGTTVPEPHGGHSTSGPLESTTR